MAADHAQWLSKDATPSYVQTDFGRFGQALPLDGEISCGATALAMSVMWLIENGFKQLLPSAGSTAPDIDLTRVFDGLAGAPAAQGGPIVNEEWYPYAVHTYLGLKGIGPSQLTKQRQIAPNVDWFAAKNQDQTIVNFAVGWYAEDAKNPGTFQRNGQHWLTLLAANPASGVLVINNPYPATFAPVPNECGSNPQRVGTVPFVGQTLPALPPGNYIQTDVYFDHPRGKQRAILETAYVWTINPSALPSSPGYAPQPFEITTPLLYINGEFASLEVIAPLQGPGGIRKWGRAELILTNTSTTSGAYEIREGMLVSTQRSSTPFGTGSIRLLGSGGLALRPGDGSPAGVTLTVAGGPENSVIFGGGNRLELDRGANASLTVTVGGWTDNHTQNLARSGTGTLRIIPRSGLAQLSRGERLLVAGASGNRPIVINGMVDASIVGQDRDGSGAFLTYTKDGLVPARTMSSMEMPIKASTATTIYAVENDQKIAAGETTAAYAICVGPHAIQSVADNTTLQVGSQQPAAAAGVILNGGSLAASTLQFGNAQGLIYTSPAGGTIASDISGHGGVTLFGPGKLRLTGTNRYGGGTVIDSGQVTVANTTDTGLGRDHVLVRAAGTLIVDGEKAHVAGHVTLERDSHLILAGGTIGGLTIEYGGHMDKGGILEGFGTISGTAKVAGTIRAGKRIGSLTFQKPVTFATTSFYWKLIALDDTPGHEGVNWNSVVFNASTSFGSGVDPIYVLLDFPPGIASPDSNDPFWRRPHQWVLAQFNDNTRWELNYHSGNFKWASGSFEIKLKAPNAYLIYNPVGIV